MEELKKCRSWGMNYARPLVYFSVSGIVLTTLKGRGNSKITSPFSGVRVLPCWMIVDNMGESNMVTIMLLAKENKFVHYKSDFEIT